MPDVFRIAYSTAVPVGGYPSPTPVDLWLDNQVKITVGSDDARVAQYIADGGSIGPYLPPNVDAERDRRIALPLTINLANPVRTFQVNMDSDALRNMSGLATSAVLAKVLNATTATSFIAYDNSIVQLSPDDLIALGQQVQVQISKLTFAGRTLKNMTPIPADFASDGYWQ